MMTERIGTTSDFLYGYEKERTVDIYIHALLRMPLNESIFDVAT